MRVFLRQDGGDAGILELDNEDTLEDLRSKVAATSGLHPSLQQLTYRSAMLTHSDNKTVGEYGIETDDDLHVTSLPMPRVIRLNVGGTRYTTLLSTLRKLPESMLARMFDGILEHCPGQDGLMEGVPSGMSTVLVPKDPDDEAVFFLDRHGPSFEYILTFLRDGAAAALPAQPPALHQLETEARYFGLLELADRCAANGPHCRVHSLEALVNECGGGVAEAEIVSMSDAELTQLFVQFGVNVLFAKRIRGQVAALREQMRAEAEAEAHPNHSLAMLTMSHASNETLRAGLARVGVELSEAGLRILTDAGLTELRAVCKLDTTGARGYGLSEEDVELIGKARQPAGGVTISLCGNESEATEQHHDPDRYRGYIVHNLVPPAGATGAISIKVVAVLLKWSTAPDKCAIIGQGNQLSRGTSWLPLHNERDGEGNGRSHGQEWFVSRFSPAVDLSAGDLIVAENVSNAARYICKSSGSGEQLKVERGDGDGLGGLIVESCRSATTGRLRYTPNGHQLCMKLVLQ